MQTDEEKGNNMRAVVTPTPSLLLCASFLSTKSLHKQALAKSLLHKHTMTVLANASPGWLLLTKYSSQTPNCSSRACKSWTASVEASTMCWWPQTSQHVGWTSSEFLLPLCCCCTTLQTWLSSEFLSNVVINTSDVVIK